MEYIERNIDQGIARDQWNNTEWADRRDSNANDRLELFNNRDYNVDLIQINQDDFSNIVLPAHAHKFINCSHEHTLHNLYDQLQKSPPDSNVKDSCQERVNHILDHFDSYSSSTFVEGKFMFITTNLELSVNDTYQLKGYFAGGFHQFAAYTLWIIRNSFRPLRLFLIQ